MADRSRRLGEIARAIRSKNAGPFWMTLDVFFDSDADFAHVRSPRDDTVALAVGRRVLPNPL